MFHYIIFFQDSFECLTLHNKLSCNKTKFETILSNSWGKATNKCDRVHSLKMIHQSKIWENAKETTLTLYLYLIIQPNLILTTISFFNAFLLYKFWYNRTTKVLHFSMTYFISFVYKLKVKLLVINFGWLEYPFSD